MKKKKKKKTLQEGYWATAQIFLSVSHNTTSCIVTQGLTGLGEQQGRVGGRRVNHDTVG